MNQDKYTNENNININGFNLNFKNRSWIVILMFLINIKLTRTRTCTYREMLKHIQLFSWNGRRRFENAQSKLAFCL